MAATKSTAAFSKATNNESLAKSKQEQKQRRARKASKPAAFNEKDFVEDSEEFKRVLEAAELDIQNDNSDESDEEGKSECSFAEVSDQSEQSEEEEEQKAPKETKGAKKKLEKAPPEKKVAKPKQKANAPAKPVSLNEASAKKAVADYMIRQNRPYSIQNILDNLRGTVPKKICETVLDALCSEKVLTMKEYGKAKIYLANQDNFPVSNPDQLAAIDN